MRTAKGVSLTDLAEQVAVLTRKVGALETEVATLRASPPPESREPAKKSAIPRYEPTKLAREEYPKPTGEGVLFKDDFQGANLVRAFNLVQFLLQKLDKGYEFGITGDIAGDAMGAERSLTSRVFRMVEPMPFLVQAPGGKFGRTIAVVKDRRGEAEMWLETARDRIKKIQEVESQRPLGRSNHIAPQRHLKWAPSALRFILSAPGPILTSDVYQDMKTQDPMIPPGVGAHILEGLRERGFIERDPLCVVEKGQPPLIQVKNRAAAEAWLANPTVDNIGTSPVTDAEDTPTLRDTLKQILATHGTLSREQLWSLLPTYSKTQIKDSLKQMVTRHLVFRKDEATRTLFSLQPFEKDQGSTSNGT